MALFLLLTDADAVNCRGMTARGSALEPRPLKAGGWVLPMRVVQDAAHQGGQLGPFLQTALQQDLDPTLVFYAVADIRTGLGGDLIPANVLSVQSYAGKVPPLLGQPPGQGSSQSIQIKDA